MAAESSGSAAPEATGSARNEALEQYLQGRLTLNEFLDGKVERAVAHLRGKVSAERLQIIKEVLREQLAESPGWVELLKRAGVRLPPPPAV